MNLFGEPEEQGTEGDEEGFASSNAASLDAIDSDAERFMHPRLALSVQRHASIETQLVDNFKSGRLHHGLIFSGPKGIGKASVAYRLARYILKYGNHDPNQVSMFGDAPALPDTLDMPRDERVFRLVASESHPDLLTIERAYDEGTGKTASGVAVADIRRVNPFLRLKSSDGGWRVVIIDDADTMNRSAQNALLKILEEPPARTLLILVTHRLGALIPTIRSRTQTLGFDALDQDAFTALMKDYDPAIDPGYIPTLYYLSGGSFGAALDYIQNDVLETLAQILVLLETAPHWDWDQIHKVAGQMGRGGKANALPHFGQIMLWALREAITARARGRQIRVPALDIPSFTGWANHSSLDKLLETWQNLDELYASVERANLDKKQAVLRTFSILAA